jgi:hypothetical protein
MNEDRDIVIVKGYHDFIEPYPFAIEHGMPHRLAYVLSSYRADKVDMYFDATLFCELMLGLEELFAPDNTQIHMLEGKVLRNVASMKKAILALPEIDQEPPESIVFRTGETIMACVQTEFWTQYGGPCPYHDSYTAAIYTGTDVSERLIALGKWVCTDTNAMLSDIIETSPVPTARTSLIGRLLSKAKNISVKVFGNKLSNK